MNSLPKTVVTRQRRDCDLNPGHSAPESSTLTTRLPSHPTAINSRRFAECMQNSSLSVTVDKYSLNLRFVHST